MSYQAAISVYRYCSVNYLYSSILPLLIIHALMISMYFVLKFAKIACFQSVTDGKMLDNISDCTKILLLKFTDQKACNKLTVK